MIKVKGTLIKRYKRFLADVLLESGEIVVAYCCNTGKLLGVPENASILLTDHGENTKRKLRYTWEWFKDEETWVGINTHDANAIVHELLIKKQIPGLEVYPHIRREVKYGEKSRVDFLLENNNLKLYLEVKSVHMRRGKTAVFPDCPTERGAKHMWELSQIINDTTRATVLYLVQRDDCDTFAIANDLDPVYAKASQAAKELSVETIAVSLILQNGKAPSFQKMLIIL